MTDIKAKPQAQSRCKSIDNKDGKVYLDGELVYNFDVETDYYPSYYDPFYKSVLENKQFTPLFEFNHASEGITVMGNRGSYVVGLIWIHDYSDPELRKITISDIKYGTDDMTPSYTIDYEKNKLERSETIGVNRQTDELDYENKIIVDYDAKLTSLPPIQTERKIVVMGKGDPVLADYLDNFIGSIEGAYRAPHAYATEFGFTIINKPLYGRVLVRTAPDSRFYLSFERNDEGVLVGEFVRTRLIPHHEGIRKGEILGCLADGTPVYISYYDPMGSGKLITRLQYEDYLRQRRDIVAQQAGFPTVLADLLGF